ncbi:hypothetical protein YC2023_011981 [Brassica napus]
MNNRGPDTNESQFIICLTENRELDDVHVVFRQVVEGLDVVRIISKEHVRDKLSRPVVIADCDVLLSTNSCIQVIQPAQSIQ